MNDHADRLRATLAELKEELHALDTVDVETRQSLEEVVGEIDAALHKDEDVEHHSLVARLREVAQGFEESHPTLARILGNLIDGLGQIGI